MDKTSPSQGENMGSNPISVIKKIGGKMIKIKFLWKKFKIIFFGIRFRNNPNVCIYCKTESEAIQFCKMMD